VKRKLQGELLWGVIVETAAYSQKGPTCHGFQRRTPSKGNALRGAWAYPCICELLNSSLLKEVYPQHGDLRLRRPPAFLFGLRLVGLNQDNKPLEGHHQLHLSEKFLSLGLLLGGGELVIQQAKLLSTHEPSPG